MVCQGRGLKRGHAHTPCPTLSRSHCLRLQRTGQFGNRSQFVLQLLLKCYQIWHFKGSDDKSDPILRDVAGSEKWLCPTPTCSCHQRAPQFGSRSQLLLYQLLLLIKLILQCYQIWHFKKTQEDLKRKKTKKRLFTINIFCLSSLTLNLRLCSKKKPKKALKKAQKRSKKKKTKTFCAYHHQFYPF